MDGQVKLDFNLEGGNFKRAGFASSEIKKLLKKRNIDTSIIKRTVVAAYEAEVNVVAHAYSGSVYVDVDNEKIKIKVIDEGPGIKDIELAMKEGYSTASREVREMGFGAGMGLPNIKKNVDEFKITSEVGKSTTLSIALYFK